MGLYQSFFLAHNPRATISSFHANLKLLILFWSEFHPKSKVLAALIQIFSLNNVFEILKLLLGFGHNLSGLHPYAVLDER